MIELATGLINLFKSETGTTPVHNALYLDIPAKLYYEEAPQGTTFPYGIFNYVSDVHDWNLSKDHFREFLTQFTFFSTTGLDQTEIEKIKEDAINLFDNSVISVSGWTFLFCHFENAPKAFRDENKVWVSPMDFRIKLEKIE